MNRADLDDLARDPSFVQMFLEEARVAAQLSHPNIVQVIELLAGQRPYHAPSEGALGRRSFWRR